MTMKREAFTAVGNPLMMGGPVLFVGGDGGSPPAIDARDPNALPVGPPWLRIWGYIRHNGPASGSDSYSIAVSMDNTRAPVFFNGGQLNVPFGATEAFYVELEGAVPGVDYPGLFEVGDGEQVAFMLRPPVGMLFGECRPTANTWLRIIASINRQMRLGGRTQAVGDNSTPAFWGDVNSMRAMGSLGETTAWVTGAGLLLTEMGGSTGNVHWDGDSWEAGVAPEPPPPPTLEQQMQAFLAGTPGYYVKPDDLTTLFQDTAGTVPVTANGQLIARVNAMGGNLSGLNFSQATLAAQPSYSAPGRYLGDGVDDLFGAPVPWVFPNMPCYFACFNVELVVLPPGARGIVAFSNNQTAFVQLTVDATGRLRLAVQNLTEPPLSAPALLAGQRRVVTILCDWTTQGRYEVFVDGVSVTSITLGPTVAPVHSNVNRHRIMSTTANTVAAINAKLGRAVISNKLPTVAERQMIEAWVGELPLADQVAAILAGTGGYALDPRDVTTMFQTNAITVPVTAPGQPVGRILGKWGLGAAANWSSGNGPAGSAVWDGSMLTFDGVDDFFNTTTPDLPNNAPAMFFCARVNLPDDGLQKPLISYSPPTANAMRFDCRVGTTGVAGLNVRRPDATPFGLAFPAPTVPLGVPATVSFQADAANALGSFWVNGVAGTPLAFGTPGNFDATVGTRFRLGTSASPTNILLGKIGRMVICPFVPTAQQRAVFEAWVGEP